MVAANHGSGIFDGDDGDHDLSDPLPPSPAYRSPSRSGVNIRIKPDALAEIRRLAARSGVPQTLYLERTIAILSLIDSRLDGCPLAAIEALTGVHRPQQN